MNRTENKDHRQGSIWNQQNCFVLFCFDDKIHTKNNGYDGLALGYQN